MQQNSERPPIWSVANKRDLLVRVFVIVGAVLAYVDPVLYAALCSGAL